MSGEATKSYFSILATLVLLIVLVVLIYPAIQHITKVNKEIADARVVKTELETKLRDIEAARINLEEIEDDLPTLDLAFPVGSDLSPYLRKIESLARKRKLTITTLQFSNVPLSKPSTSEDLKTTELSYNLTLEGKFPNFRKFLTDLENYIRTSDVLGISLNKQATGEVLEALNVTTYYMGVEFVPDEESTGTQSGGANE
jgi:Tfp pilus assembly protein PilO